MKPTYDPGSVKVVMPVADIFSSYRDHWLGMVYGEYHAQSKSYVFTSPFASTMKAYGVGVNDSRQ